MLYLIYITIATAAGGILLALISDTFADGVSRALEAALDSIEYHRALRQQRRGLNVRRRREAQIAYEVSYPARVEISL